MKITAGFHSTEDYLPFVRAGADELFCGYIPHSWTEQNGISAPLNRREVLFYPVQIGAESELLGLSDLVRTYGVPVSLAFNSLFYLPEQYREVCAMIKTCMEAGFPDFIAADPALLFSLSEAKKTDPAFGPIRIHLSGEFGQITHPVTEKMRDFGVSRFIFHRQTDIEDMACCIRKDRECHPEEKAEFEAFVLNEKCHYTGAWCHTWHCDELAPACRLPYRPGRYEKTKEKDFGKMAASDLSQKGSGSQKSVTALKNACEVSEETGAAAASDFTAEDACEIPGETGCGICALWRLQEAGITHVKIVSRGNYPEKTIRDIRLVRTALDLLAVSGSEEEYQKKVFERLFPKGCGKNCYYSKPSGFF